jgi:hypothetical protein
MHLHRAHFITNKDQTAGRRSRKATWDSDTTDTS